MVDLFFATCRENTTTGYAALMIEGRALPSDATARGEADRESKDIFKAILSRVPAEKEITVHLKSGERLLSEVSGKKLYKALAARGHPTVGVLVHDPTSDEETDGDFNNQKILTELKSKARAAAWSLRLNPQAFVPGPSVSTEKAQSLHRRAYRNGFTEGGIRLLLSEYGLISTKEVTSAIYDKLRNRFSSEAVAKIYNERYQQGQYAQSEVQ
jgi:hypothetical protein